MKTKLLLFFGMTSLAGFSQMPINSYYGADMGVFAVVSSPVPLNQEASGSNASWSFTGFTEIGEVTDYNDTPTAQELLTYPNTTAKVQTLGMVNNQDTQSQVFSSESDGAISINGVFSDGLQLNYSTDNAMVGTYPLNFGYSNSDTTAGTFNYTTYSGTFTGTLSTDVDAYGTLTMTNPLSGNDYTISVTRLKSLQNISLFYPPFGNVGTITITTYSYFNDLNGNNTPDFRYASTTMIVPLLSINQTRTRMEMFMNQLLATQVPISALNSLVISPNPVNDIITVKTTEIMRSITIYDMNGRLVLESNSPVTTINISALQSGLYLAEIKTDNGTVTKKIVKK